MGSFCDTNQSLANVHWNTFCIMSTRVLTNSHFSQSNGEIYIYLYKLGCNAQATVGPYRRTGI